jgi:hypothetical protein
MAGSLQHNRGAMHRVVLASLLGLATASLGGCLFVDTINTAPTAGIRLTPGAPPMRGDVVTVEPVVADAEGDDLDITWHVTVCDLARIRCRRLDDVIGDGNPYAIVVPSRVSGDGAGEVEVLVERLTIELTVRDERGAVTVAPAPVELLIGNAPPVLVGEIQAEWRSIAREFPVDVPIEISVVKDDPDGPADKVRVVASLFRDGQPVTDVDIVDLQVPGVNELFAFRPDRTGNWTVVFALTDSLGAPNVLPFEVDLGIVEDTHPCIESLSPSFAGPVLVEAPRRFSVLGVSDDKDEYPAQVIGDLDVGVATFRWSRSRPGSPLVFEPIGDLAAADLVIDPAHYAPGDRFAVRVDVDDRVARGDCGPTEPRCIQKRPGDVSCARRMTWEIEVR